MNRLHMPRRFPMMLASLALLVVPFGCSSDTTTTVEVPTPPTVVVERPGLRTDPDAGNGSRRPRAAGDPRPAVTRPPAR